MPCSAENRLAYLTLDHLDDEVVKAQSIPWLRMLLESRLVAEVSLYGAVKGERQTFRSAIGNSSIHVVTAWNRGVWSPRTWMNFLVLGLAARRSGARILVGRGPFSLLLLAAIRRGRGRLVLDARGLLAEEFALQGKFAAGGLRQRMFRWVERAACRKADVVICVSRRLATFLRRMSRTDGGRFKVVPCCASPEILAEMITPDPDLRARLGLAADAFVIGYVGSLSAWNRVDLMLDLFRTFYEVEKTSRFLVLTTDVDRVRRALENQAELHSSVVVRTVPHTEMKRYLGLADIGLLLRDRHRVNRVASPVKFAEYLACGVPVLISPGVGDYSEMVASSQVGFVHSNPPAVGQIISAVRADREGFRRRCRELAVRQFDRAAYLLAYREVLDVS